MMSLRRHTLDFCIFFGMTRTLNVCTYLYVIKEETMIEYNVVPIRVFQVLPLPYGKTSVKVTRL